MGFYYSVGRPEHNKPDLAILEKKICYVVDVGRPFTTKIDESERTKINKYTDLRYKLLKCWQGEVDKVLIIPIVISALGSVT